MPAWLEHKLREEAVKAIPIPPNASPQEKERLERRRDAYVYDTMRKIEEYKRGNHV